MADNGRHADSGSGEGDSTNTLWRAFKRLFHAEGDQSLRAQLEEVINAVRNALSADGKS